MGNILPPSVQESGKGLSAPTRLAAFLLSMLLLVFPVACKKSSGSRPSPPAPPYRDMAGAGNAHNLGLAASDGTWTYYAFMVFDIQQPQGDLMGIYRTRADGTGSPVKIRADLGLDLHLIGGKLYFTSVDADNQSALFLMNPDGTGEEKLLSLEGVFKDLTYCEGFFYYIENMADIDEFDHGLIYRLPIGGGPPEQISAVEAYAMGAGQD
ncbi:MAG: DUF5050 domain-containing protein [Thermodesulfobacteriota bacterium]